MAVDAPEPTGVVVCPLCEDYQGPRASVEAHISRLQDEQHKGEVGQGHRRDLQPPGADRDGTDRMDDPTTDDAPDTSDSVDGSGATTTDSDDGSAASAVDPATAAAGAAAAPVVFEDVDPKVLLAAIAFVVIVGYLLLHDSGSSTASEAGSGSADRSGQERDRSESTEGGLMA